MPRREIIPVENQRPSAQPDSWGALKQFTTARIALGRAGASWRTESLLAFRLAQARARDAVCRTFDADLIGQQLRQLGYETARLSTQAQSQATFLKRPDLGRKLSEESRRFLIQNSFTSADQRPFNSPSPGGEGRGEGEQPSAGGADSADHQRWSGRHLAVMVSDGLSSLAAEAHAVPTLAKLLLLLQRAGWTICPIFIVPYARMKLQDEIGVLLGARHALALLGERPGLGSPDSLGAYFTWQPGLDKTDADRNCVSNIHSAGLPPVAAAEKLAQLLLRSAEQRCSGIQLKETVEPFKTIE